MGVRVLLADDDPDFLDVTAYALRRAGYLVDTASTGKEALEGWRSQRPDIVLLDVSISDHRAMEVCEVIRQESSTPVVLLDSNDLDADIIRGFEAGADDYLTKPFSVQHLVLRLRALQRRTATQASDVVPKYLVAAPFVMDLDSYNVEVEQHGLRLTRLEFRILYCLVASMGRVVSTDRLIDFAWEMDADVEPSLLKTHISHIRRKLREALHSTIRIQSLPGVGYLLESC